jgi:hypothetical protein
MRAPSIARSFSVLASARSALAVPVGPDVRVGSVESVPVLTGASMRLSVPVSHAALSGAVKHVVAIGTNKEVVRPDAWRVVAFVADEQAWRYWPVGYFPRHAMCQPTTSVAHANPAVTVLIASARTYPATVALLDAVPQAFLQSRLCCLCDVSKEALA